MALSFDAIATGLGFPEGPVAMADGSVLFVDIMEQTLSRVLPGQKPEQAPQVVAHLPGGPNGAAIGPDGAAYVCNNGGVYSFNKQRPTIPGPTPSSFKGGCIQRVDLATGQVDMLYDSCDGQKLMAPDDIVFDKRGGFWFTDTGYQDGAAIHKGGVYYAKIDGSSIQRKAAITMPNGIGLSPDGKTLYVSDTPFGRLWALDLDADNNVKPPGPLPPTVMPGRVMFTLPGLQWVDSLKVEADGRVCVGTLINGGITVFNPTDNSTQHVSVAGPEDLMITNLCFGGSDMQDVFITASSTGRILKGRWPRPGLKPAFNGCIVDEILTLLNLPDAVPDRLRRVHTIGIGAHGTFRPSKVAKLYCKAEHFQKPEHPIDVTVRFSNGLGSPTQHDGWGEPKGMATRFHLSKGAATDLIAMTLPSFPHTPEDFRDLLREAKPQVPPVADTPWQKFLKLLQLRVPLPRNPYPGEKYWTVPGALRYADRNASVQSLTVLVSQIGAPVSYARATYHAVHAFTIVAPDGVRRSVRFSWRAVDGARNTDPKALPKDDYLQGELRKRLARDPERFQPPTRFTLVMRIGEAGDDPTDSSRRWPPSRPRVVMGELTLDKVFDDQDACCELLSFNPMLLVDGIEASKDPMLELRGEAYRRSSHQRGGTPCPFMRSWTDDGQ